MIKINFSYNDAFLRSYTRYVMKALPESLEKFKLSVPDDDKPLVFKVITIKFVQDLPLCKASDLMQKITSFYDQLPILAERYCIEYYLKDLKIDSSFLRLNLKTKSGTEDIKSFHTQVILDITSIAAQRKSVYLPFFLERMKSATTVSNIKRILTILLSIKNGDYNFTMKEKELFPQWVNEFTNIFNYEAMSKIFGREITNNLNLNICPYCNNEDIETINIKGAESRPDLDHFYPKSKFPFLALTLSNLVPAGKRCNQTYKKSSIMFGYVNPYIDGIKNNPLFNFDYLSDEGRNIDSLNITLKTQNNDLDKNLSFFKVGETHNKENIKNWFLKLEERLSFYKNTDPDFLSEILSDSNSIRIHLDVDIQRSPIKEQFQKFKIEALNNLSNRKYNITD